MEKKKYKYDYADDQDFISKRKWNLLRTAPSCNAGEMLFFNTLDKVSFFFGFGVVQTLTKGEEYDIARVSFNKRVRTLVFEKQDARKQFILLRINKPALFVGFLRYLNDKNILFVQTIFVPEIPKAIDIKKGKYLEDDGMMIGDNDVEYLNLVDFLNKNKND